jgi:hypothetical protein
MVQVGYKRLVLEVDTCKPFGATLADWERDVVGAAVATLVVLGMSETHAIHEVTYVSAARHPIRSLDFASKEASSAIHMASCQECLASRILFALLYINELADQLERPVLRVSPRSKLPTYALGA